MSKAKKIAIASFCALAIVSIQETRAQSLGQLVGAVISAPFHLGEAVGSAIHGAYESSVFGSAPSLASDYSDGYGGGYAGGYGGSGGGGAGGGAPRKAPPPMKVLFNGKVYLPEDVPTGVQNEGSNDAIQALYVEKDPAELEALFSKNEAVYSKLVASADQELMVSANKPMPLYCSAFCGGFDSNVTLQGDLVVKGGTSQAQIFEDMQSGCLAKNAHLFREYRRHKIRSGETVQDIVDISAQTVSCHTSDELAAIRVQKMIDVSQSTEQNLENARLFGQIYMKTVPGQSEGSGKSSASVTANDGN